MTIVFGLLIISLLLAASFLAAFIWAVKSGQFEDTVTPGMRIMGDDPSSTTPSSPRPSSVPPASRLQP